MHLPFWLFVTLLIGAFVAGALIAWNNPKKKFQGLLDDEIAKAKVTADKALQDALTAIKAKL
jgi:hypothetical protein